MDKQISGVFSCTTWPTFLQRSKGTWEAAKQATSEAEKQGATAHLKSCEAEHLLKLTSELQVAAADARAREEEVRNVYSLCLPQLFVQLWRS